MRWFILIGLVMSVAFVVAAARNVGAESIHVCAWVEKPKPGQKCVTVDVLGYKGRLCK